MDCLFFLNYIGFYYWTNSYKYIDWIDENAQQHTCIKRKLQDSTEMK